MYAAQLKLGLDLELELELEHRNWSRRWNWSRDCHVCDYYRFVGPE